MPKNDHFTLTKPERDEMISEIKHFFQIERDEDIGDLAADIVLDFILEKLSPKFYNRGLADAHDYFLERTEDLLGLQKY